MSMYFTSCLVDLELNRNLFKEKLKDEKHVYKTLRLFESNLVNIWLQLNWLDKCIWSGCICMLKCEQRAKWT